MGKDGPVKQTGPLLDRDLALPGEVEPVDADERLQMLSSLATRAGAEEVARQAHDLAGRVRERRFYVACVGQFKRGKSTVLNALVGHEPAPNSWTPPM